MKAIIRKLKQIKHQCEQHVDCADCPLWVDSEMKCEAKDIGYRLCCRPSDWDLRGLDD